jgi:hypothetical protein
VNSGMVSVLGAFLRVKMLLVRDVGKRTKSCSSSERSSSADPAQTRSEEHGSSERSTGGGRGCAR